MVRERAARFGADEILRFRDKFTGRYNSVTWAGLIETVNKVSRALLSLGYTYKSRIGIYADNKPEWTMADLGILQIRGVVVPFFGTASYSQLQYIVNETDMDLIFVGNDEQKERALKLADREGKIRRVIGLDPSMVADSEIFFTWKQFLTLGENLKYDARIEELLSLSETGDIATIIYTSGTTGDPKGVMLTHENFMYCMKIHDDRLDVGRNDVSLCFLPLSHVFERAWTYYILYRGAVNVYLENPKSVIDVMPAVRPTVMCTVPRFFEKTYEGIQHESSQWPAIKRRIFSWAIETGRANSDYLKLYTKPPLGLVFRHRIADMLVLKTLRKVFGGRIRFMPCAGAAISPELLQFFHAAGIFVNYGYGATETTATVSCFRPDIYEFESAGTIMPGVQVDFTPEGEILVKGKTVFAGYYRKPDETARVLVDGWYHTGDIGKLTELGNLLMIDRLNDIFKTSGGKFISPQKIELLLCDDNFIDQVIVIGDGRKYITALIVPSIQKLRNQFGLLGEKADDAEVLVNEQAVIDFMKLRIDRLQTELAPYERVVRFKLLPEMFTIENESLTATLKVRRKIVEQKYSALIAEMYR